MSTDERVIHLATANKDRQPPLTDAELIRIRAMLEQFDAIKYGCPSARRLLHED